MSTCVLLAPSLEGGGAERVFVDLARALHREGVSVHVVCIQRKGELADELDSFASIHVLGASRLALSLFKIRSIIKLLQPDVVLSTMTHTNVIGLIALRVLSTFSGNLIVQEVALFSRGRATKDRVVSLLAKVLYRRADKVVAVSKAIKSELFEFIGVPLSKIELIPNPVDLCRVRELSKEPVSHPWARNPGVRLVVAVGRLSKEKGYDNLLQAFSIAFSKDSSLRLIVIGEGGERRNLENIIKSLGLSEVCALLGYVKNPYPLLAAGGVFVLSSVAEGFSLVTVEALACEVNVIVTECGSEPVEIVDNGRLGKIVPIRKPVEMADAILDGFDIKVDRLSVCNHIGKYDVHIVVKKYLQMILS